MKLPERSKPQRIKKDWQTIKRASSSGLIDAVDSAVKTITKWTIMIADKNLTFCNLLGPILILVTSRNARWIKQNAEVKHGKAMPKSSSVSHSGSLTPFSLDSYGSNSMYTALVAPRTKRRELIARNKGLRQNPFLIFTITIATRQWTARKPKRIPKPIQCSCHANPQIFFATGQSGPGSAKASVGKSVGMLDTFDMSSKLCIIFL